MFFTRLGSWDIVFTSCRLKTRSFGPKILWGSYHVDWNPQVRSEMCWISWFNPSTAWKRVCMTCSEWNAQHMDVPNETLETLETAWRCPLDIPQTPRGFQGLKAYRLTYPEKDGKWMASTATTWLFGGVQTLVLLTMTFWLSKILCLEPILNETVTGVTKNIPLANHSASPLQGKQSGIETLWSCGKPWPRKHT